METKLFEIRDRMTFIPVICIKLVGTDADEKYLLAAAGYDPREEVRKWYILMAKLDQLNFVDHPNCHPGWPVVRTLPAAHHYIIKHWEELRSGEVIDVEYISGESTKPKPSQRLEQC